MKIFLIAIGIYLVYKFIVFLTTGNPDSDLDYFAKTKKNSVKLESTQRMFDRGRHKFGSMTDEEYNERFKDVIKEFNLTPYKSKKNI